MGREVKKKGKLDCTRRKEIRGESFLGEDFEGPFSQVGERRSMSLRGGRSY